MVIDETPYIDGGVWDHAGLMAMPEAIRAADVKGGSGIGKNNSDNIRVNVEHQDGDCGDNSVVDVRAADYVDTNNDKNMNNFDEDGEDDDDSDDSDVNHGNSSSTVTNLIEASKTDIDDVPSTETTTEHHQSQHHHHHHHHPLRKLVVNIIFGRSYISTSKLPVELSSHKVRMMTILLILMLMP